MTRSLLFLLALSMPACGLPWQDTVHTADELAVALCKSWVTQHPQGPITDAMCDVGGDVFSTVVAMINAKADPQQIKAALADYPPMPTVMPCIKPPIEPQSRIDRKLYPMRIVEPPVPGE
jgi:hypothetical protein